MNTIRVTPGIGVNAENPMLWSEWRKQWDETKTFPGYLGLLRCVFDVTVSSGAEETQRIVFLHELANDWRVERYVEREEKLEPAKESSLRKAAFKVLAKRLYRPVAEDGTITDVPLNRILALPEALEAILCFFGCSPGGEGWGLRNVRHRDQTPSEKLAWSFAWRLSHQIWLHPRWKQPEQILPHVVKARPKALEIIERLGRNYLFALLPDDPEKCVAMENRKTDYEYWSGFDEPALAKLEELALAYGTTVEIAAANKSAAAQVLLIVRAVLTESKKNALAKS